MIRTSTPAFRRPRPGFTLVELMVAAAISVLIMAILATAFQMGIDTMRQLRSAADMATQLRAAQEVIRRDLQGDCFVPDDTKPNNGLKVSDQRFDQNITGNILFPSPVGGYMAINSGMTLSEGADADGFTSTITTGHTFQFTSVLKNNSEQNVFSTVSPPGSNGQTFTSRAAEIGYFLAPMPSLATTNGLGGAPLPLFNLHRRQRLVAYGDEDAIGLSNAGPDIDVISLDPAKNVNTLRAVTNPANRLILAPLTGSRLGEDVLLSNVISFEAKVKWVPQPGSGQPFPRGFGTAGVPTGTLDNPAIFNSSSDSPFDTLAVLLPPFTNTFDTAGTPSAGGMTLPQIRVLALQIRIRVYDPKLNSARQITIIQNL